MLSAPHNLKISPMRYRADQTHALQLRYRIFSINLFCVVHLEFRKNGGQKIRRQAAHSKGLCRRLTGHAIAPLNSSDKMEPARFRKRNASEWRRATEAKVATNQRYSSGSPLFDRCKIAPHHWPA